MRHFFRNIKGSTFWRQVLSLTMVFAVVATLMPANLEFAWSADNTDLISASTQIDLNTVDLTAQYKDADGKKTTVELNQNDTIQIPYDADIIMNLQFIMANGSLIDGNTTYTYKLPNTVRVDVDATHELVYQGNQSIGQVHIKKDGTLDFRFYEDVLENKTNVPFYVQFEGNFSSECQEEGKQIEIKFPASDGSFDFNVVTDPASEPEKENTSKDIGVSKSGNVITAADGKRYIEWNVYLSPNGRDSIDGNIVDALPSGLTYVEGNGYPKIQENQWGGNYGQVTASQSNQTVTLSLSGTGSSPINVKFLTSYTDVFNTAITSGGTQVDNSVIFNPDNTVDKSVSSSGSVWIYPNMVSKAAGSGSLQLDVARNQYYIDWSVTLNAEQLNIAGATYTDTMGTGLIAPSASDITVTSSNGTSTPTPTVTTDGFKISFPGGTFTDTVTIQYRTYVDNSKIPQGQFTNTAELSGGKIVDKFTQTATVNGVNYLDKTIGYTEYDKITKTFRWTITVNQDRGDLKNVVVTDTFNPNEMVFVSATSPLAGGSNSAGGTLVFNLGDIKDTVVIQVVTRVNPNYTQTDGWHDYKNFVTMTSDGIPDFSDDASFTVNKDWEVPDFVSKTGTMNGDGTISWLVRVQHISDDVTGMKFTDLLPTNMEYVDGSFYLREYWWESEPDYRTPTKGTDGSGRQTLSYTLNPTGDAYYMDHDQGYAIGYKTRITNADAAIVSGDYTNDAKVQLNFPDNIQVEDETSTTVTGVPGGVLDKTYTYQSGREVVWHVKVNEARLNLNVTDPVIEDQLADYFDYVSGTLYLVAEDGSRSPVPQSDYYVTTVNRKLMVQLPDITNQCYEFEFMTRFNPKLPDSLYGKTITNSVTLVGRGKSYDTTSDELQNVEYSSSSAGAVLNQELRIKKVDLGDPTMVLPGATFQLLLNGVVVGEATSGSNGYAVFKNMDSSYGYTFDLVEVTAPNGYKKEADLDSITFVESGLSTDANGVQYMEVVIKNESLDRKTVGDVSVVKVDAADNNRKLSGAVFGIYTDAACTDASLVQTMKTGTDGVAIYTGLEPDIYYIREITSPEGYVEDRTALITAALIQNANRVDTIYTYGGSVDGEGRPVIENEKIKASLTIHKVDNNAQNPASLAGATIGLYGDSTCDNLLVQKTTDGSGTVTFENLIAGKTYYYREDKAPTGYVRDAAIHMVKLGEGTEHTNVAVTETITNQPAKGRVVITKYGDDGKLLEGVQFRLTLNGSGSNLLATTDANGVARFDNLAFGTYTIHEVNGLNNYIVAADTTVVVNKAEDTNVDVINQAKKATIRITKTDVNGGAPLANAEFGLFTTGGLRVATAWTNSSGVVEFKDVAYGNYYIQELTPPAGYKENATQYPVTTSAFNTAITNNAQNPVITQSVTNEKQNGRILLMKVDGTNGANTSLAGATYTLYDSLGQVYKTTKSMTSAEAGASGVTGAGEGSIYFEGLPYGIYYIQETQAPDTYLRDTGYYKVVINSDTIQSKYYLESDSSNANPMTASFTNVKQNPPWVSFKMRKVDEDGTALPGATFGFYADNVLIATAVSGDDGIAYFRRIGINDISDNAKFTIKEIKAPAGYEIDNTLTVTINGKNNMRSFSDSDSEGDPSTWMTDALIPWVNNLNQSNSTFKNDSITGTIVVTKHGMTDLESLAGAEFTLYEADGTTVVSTAVTGSDGTVTFKDIPYGSYIIRETKPPKGHTLNPNPLPVDITTQGQVVQAAMRDSRINVTVSKQAVGGAVEIPGAVLQVKGPDGTVIDTWTTADTAHRVTYSALEVDQTYTLTEVTAPKGYAYTQDVRFRIEQNGDITLESGNGEVNAQTIIMRDEPFALSVSKIDSADSGQPNPAQLPNAILALYDEDNAELERWTTDTEVHEINCSNLVAPKTGYRYYTLKEISAPFGYEIAENIRIALDSRGKFYQVDAAGGMTDVTNVGITMEDVKKPDGTFYVRKIDTSTGVALAGAEFTIRNHGAESLMDENGIPLTGSMWTWVSGDVPHKFDARYLAADNPAAVYDLVETKAPEGYTLAEPVAFRIVTDPILNVYKIEYVSGNEDVINSSRDTFRVEDNRLSLTIRKQNEFGLCLSGAELKLSEYNTKTNTIGREVIRFTSGKVPEVIDPKLLNPNQSYILQEIVTPEGYGKAEDIVFTINKDATVEIDGVPAGGNTVIMEDFSSGIIVNKLTEGQEFLPGAVLELTSKDDLTFTTKRWESGDASKGWDMVWFKPGCTYILTEISAPNGYAYAETMEFTITTDGTGISVNGSLQNNRILNMIDRNLELYVNKMDSVDQVMVAGATLEIRDVAGNVLVGPWVTGPDNRVDISSLAAGNGYPNEVDTNPDALQEYVLHESLAPASHKYALDIHFAIDRDGEIYYINTGLFGQTVYNKAENHTLVMQDDPKLVVDKQDENGQRVDGATLMITSAEDASFQSITINTTPYYIESGTLKPNVTYTLTEIGAPKGYAYGKSYDFKVDEFEVVWIDGKKADNKIIMVDETIKVTISKQDITNKHELPGAKLEIRDETGAVIYEFVSGTEPTLIPFEVFTAPTPGNMAYYTLTEITAPDGYEVAETIYFALDSEGRVYIRNAMGEYVLQDSNTIVMLDQPTVVSDTPKTGDSVPLNLIILLGLISMFVACVLLYYNLIVKTKE